jgi:hypothetical protein
MTQGNRRDHANVVLHHPRKKKKKNVWHTTETAPMSTKSLSCSQRLTPAWTMHGWTMHAASQARHDLLCQNQHSSLLQISTIHKETYNIARNSNKQLII